MIWMALSLLVWVLAALKLWSIVLCSVDDFNFHFTFLFFLSDMVEWGSVDSIEPGSFPLCRASSYNNNNNNNNSLKIISGFDIVNYLPCCYTIFYTYDHMIFFCFISYIFIYCVISCQFTRSYFLRY